MTSQRFCLLTFCLATLSVLAHAGNGKNPYTLTVTDPVTKVNSQGVISDSDNDGCWDIITGQSANGATFSCHVIDGQCNGALNGATEVTLIDGSLESASYVIALRDPVSKQTLGLLLKDAGSAAVSFIPGIRQGKDSQSTVENIGIQMSVGGELAVIAVPDHTNASVKLVQTNGESTALYNGELATGNTTISLPPTASTGAYILSVVTDSGTQSVAFTLQR